MAKKKPQGKKHKFKHVQATANVGSAPVAETGVSPKPTVKPRGNAVAAAANVRDFSYVAGDLRRIAVLASCLVALEIVIWYVFSHTGVGPAVYSLIKV